MLSYLIEWAENYFSKSASFLELALVCSKKVFLIIGIEASLAIIQLNIEFLAAWIFEEVKR
jgi:hypothetical protein